MAIDRPVATQRFETSPEGEDVVVVEVSVLSGDRRACVILLDLSDSSTLAAQDVRRLRKVLQVVPRDWAAIVRPFGRREGGAAGLDSTVGEVVDGAADIEGTLLGDESLRTGRMTGSFLGHALRQAAIDDVASRFEATLLLVLTDGRLHDVTAVELPRGVSAVGMGIGPAIDIHRWQDIVPHAELLAPSRSDTMAVGVSSGFGTAAVSTLMPKLADEPSSAVTLISAPGFANAPGISIRAAPREKSHETAPSVRSARIRAASSAAPNR